MTTPTPRTDAAIIRDRMILSEVGLLEIVDAGTCRQLERDLAAAQERINKSEADIAAMTTYAKTQQERAEAAEARAEANARDAERYRWLRIESMKDEGEAEVTFLDMNEDGSSETYYYMQSVSEMDAAIDAAIAEGKK